MIKFIRNLFKGRKQQCNTSVVSRSKDPKDYTKCKLSTRWKSDYSYCRECMKSTGYNEFTADICNGCGGFDTQVRFGRSYRKIKIDGKWKYQIRYRNGREDLRDGWYGNETETYSL